MKETHIRILNMFFQLVKSIDSLALNGSIRDAIAKTADDFVSVMLVRSRLYIYRFSCIQ